MNQRSSVLLLFISIFILYFLAIDVDTMDIDASQYASMSCEMKESGSYLQVYEQGRDYLDKPPFLFWINSISMSILGENNIAFKLPSILFAILAVFATFKLASLFYEREIAILSALILASSQALFLITNDIKTDTILMGWVSIALWQLATWTTSGKIKHLYWGAAAIAFGMMTKGPIALIAPALALSAHFILKRDFKKFIEPHYVGAIAFMAILLLPMSIGLYQQFDQHPEKWVNGEQNVSGLRFFYWTQSFGRITGESVWHDPVPFTFLLENLMWAWLPWSLFFLGSIVYLLFDIVRKKFRLGANEEFISVGGFVLTYCALGISRFQLPHYIYVVLPLIAIMTARFVYALFWENKYPRIARVISLIQMIVLIILTAIPFLILTFTFPTQKIWPWMAALMPILLIGLALNQPNWRPKIIAVSLATVMGVNMFLSTWFYPNLLQYQASNEAGRYLLEQGFDKSKLAMFQFKGSAFGIHFYSKSIIPHIKNIDSIQSGMIVVTDIDGRALLDNSNKIYELKKEGLDFHISMLTPEFLNRKKRAQELKRYFVLEMK
ncbi:MAG: glycosyltransferase family 39 protein [Hydrotalea sp.]|nr:glycosyltransferase family 39 protein [Hydrotalea sp.]